MEYFEGVSYDELSGKEQSRVEEYEGIKRRHEERPLSGDFEPMDIHRRNVKERRYKTTVLEADFQKRKEEIIRKLSCLHVFLLKKPKVQELIRRVKQEAKSNTHLDILEIEAARLSDDYRTDADLLQEARKRH